MEAYEILELVIASVCHLLCSSCDFSTYRQRLMLIAWNGTSLKILLVTGKQVCNSRDKLIEGWCLTQKRKMMMLIHLHNVRVEEANYMKVAPLHVTQQQWHQPHHKP